MDEILTAEDQKIVDLLWDYLKKDPDHKDWRMTGFGSKTKLGLVRSIRYVVLGDEED